MSEHTPGPWKLQECPHGGAILLRGDSNERHVQSHLQIVPIEDARLIAAAPDLLEVLEDIKADTGASGWWWGEKMLAAIAKAKGSRHE